jgi:hypothetical protein
MRLPTLYLCGPINGCTDEEAMDWRGWVKTHYAGPTLDPMRRDYRGKEDEAVNDIVGFDKIDVMNSDVLLVNAPSPSWGTAMEVFFAFERGKLVVVVVQPNARISPWLRYHSHRIFQDFPSALQFIKEHHQ